jgi:predicted nucleotidyltransferase
MHKNQPRKFKKIKQKVIPTTDKSQGSVETAILNTLKYRQIFDCPMSCHQIWNFLISSKHIDEQIFTKALNEMVRDNKINLKGSWYFVGKIDEVKIEKRRERAEKLGQQARKITGYLKQIPWIEMIAVTGSVAAYNADDRSDIDMMVVTKPNRLWLTRLFLVSALKLLGVYWNTQKPAGTICPNILITFDNLTWSSDKQNVYTANEVSLLCPLFFRHNCYFTFLHQNSWVTRYLGNILIPDCKPQPPTKPTAIVKLADLIEMTVMNFQMLYMKNKKTTEIVSKNFVHFNTNDASGIILQKFGGV